MQKSSVDRKNYVDCIDKFPNFVEIENDVLSFWCEQEVFKHSLEKNLLTNDGLKKEDPKNFIFYDGPPFANGKPHIGHMLTGYAKDSIGRFQTMLGKFVERRFGWDCHGLPAEMAACKELGFSSKKDIEEYSIKSFNEHCSSSVMKYASIWREYVERQGRWVDFNNDYKTMDKSFMESVCWAFKRLYDSGLIYEGLKIVPYSWACETPLSNFEIRLDDSYREKTSKSTTVLFEILEIPKSLKDINIRACNLMVWTTTPWTLISNLAIAINQYITYEALVVEGECYISIDAEKQINNILKRHKSSEYLIRKIKGSELLGIKYKSLFNYFEKEKNAFVILHADFVTEADGTGIVHIAPGFGEDDFELCNKQNIKSICPIDSKAFFNSSVGEFAGMHVFESIDKVIAYLKESKRLLSIEQYIHKYPHCWRTDTPLIYRAMSSWYLNVSKIKDRMCELNAKVNWFPEHVRDGQFGKWLKGSRDWAISRSRFFGTPILVWKSDDDKYPRIDVYGCIEDLEKDFGVNIKSLHRQDVDQLIRKNPSDPTGKSNMIRVEDVFDCWFESGSMPFASFGYPFNLESYKNNKDNFDVINNCPERIPADFIAEYIAQTRGWFYTMTVLSVALFDKMPFKNVLCHGVVLDSNGKKLSKKSGNYGDPIFLMDKFGSDSLRALMLSSQVMNGGNLIVSDSDLQDISRTLIRPIWNAHAFFITYANIDNVVIRKNLDDISSIDEISKNAMDRFIVLKSKIVVSAIKKSLESYDFPFAYKALINFFDILNNWYIRRNKKRFWGDDLEKQNAYETLFFVLGTLIRASAPLLPFISEIVYANIFSGGLKEAKNSVHLQNYPCVEKIKVTSDDLELLKDMEFAMDVCNSIHAIRNRAKIRVRQPLSAAKIISKIKVSDDSIKTICNETNIKSISFSNEFDKYASVKPKIDFKKLATRVPEKVKYVVQEIKKNNWQIEKDVGGLNVGDCYIRNDEFDITIVPKFENVSQIGNFYDSIVVLDCNVTHELWKEGVARDFIRFIQTTRQKMFSITDRINLFVETDKEIQSSILCHLDYIKAQILANNIFLEAIPKNKIRLSGEIEGKKIVVSIEID